MYGNLCLHAVKDWNETTMCAPLAISAVTGQPLNVVKMAIKKATTQHGLEISEDGSVNPKEWSAALNIFGYTYDILQDRSSPQITLDEYIQNNKHTSLVLVVSIDDTQDKGHVFAAHGHDFVDWYTKGEIEKFHITPDNMTNYMVTYVLEVRRIPST